MKFFLLILTLILYSSSQAEAKASELDRRCQPNLSLKDGWLGGDVANSIALDQHDQMSLWIFGDTFIGDPMARNRMGSKMIDNSIAISTCTAQGFQIKYFWGQQGGQPTAFFSQEKNQLWPASGQLIRGVLYLFMLEIDKNHAQSDGFGFEILGTRLLTVRNWQDDPKDWQINFSKFYPSQELIIGSSLLVDGDYLLLYSSLHKTPSQAIALLRCPLSQIEQGPLEILSKNGWKSFVPELVSEALHIAEGASTEFSVSYHEGKYWLIHNSLLKGFPATAVNSASAEGAEGPFRDIQTLALFPSNEDLGTSQIFCYASKEHPEYFFDHTLSITYTCNSFDFYKDVLANMRVYTVRLLTYNLLSGKVTVTEPSFPLRVLGQ